MVHSARMTVSTIAFTALILVYFAMLGLEHLLSLFILTIVSCILAQYLATKLFRAHGDLKLFFVCFVLQLKLLLTVVVLHLGWEPMLKTFSATVGYDPGRYYYQAVMLAAASLDSGATSVVSMNYMGVVYYYGLVFKVFGASPYVAAIVNCAVSSVAIWLLVHCCYSLRRTARLSDWRIALVALLPELIWYDALTSRETICLAGLHLSLLPLSLYLLKPSNALPGISNVILMSSGLIGVAFVRSWVLLPIAFCSLSYLLMKVRRSNRFVAACLVTTAAGAAIVLPDLGIIIGSRTLSYEDARVTSDVFDGVASGNAGNAVARYFVPRSEWQYVVYAPIRVAMNIVAPLPYYVAGPDSFYLWQHTAHAMTACVFIILLPFALTPLFAISDGQLLKRWATCALPYGAAMFAISVGYPGIHERYRVMASALLLGSAWLGRDAPGATRRQVSILWGAIVICGLGGYLVLRSL